MIDLPAKYVSRVLFMLRGGLDKILQFLFSLRWNIYILSGFTGRHNHSTRGLLLEWRECQLVHNIIKNRLNDVFIFYSREAELLTR